MKNKSGERIREPKQPHADGVSKKICGKTFPVAAEGSRKDVLQIDWETYRKIRYDIDEKDIKQVGNLRGTILWNGRRILTEEKMRTLMFTAQFLNPEQDFIETIDRQPHPFGDALLRSLPLLLKLTPFEKNGKNLGFVYLRTVKKGNYALDVTAKFTVAVNESLGTLEELVDLTAGKATARQTEQLNRVYRRLSIIEDKF